MKAGRQAIVFAILALAASASAMSVSEALGQIETGANRSEQCAADSARGPAGEISRYQLLPSVWRAYGGGDPTDPAHAWDVAALVIHDRCEAFESAVRRQPTARELYALWTAPGQFAKRNYDWQRLSPAVRERSQRFANLMEVKNANDFAREEPALRPGSTNSLFLTDSVTNLPPTNGGSVMVGGQAARSLPPP
jgi:hypothetical protein